MKVGEYVYTPRFCTVRISEVFSSKEEAFNNGFTESTHFKGDFYVLGKSLEINRMVFAVAEK